MRRAMWEKHKVRVLIMQQPGSGVSKAVYPVSVHYSVASSRVAQLRRLLTIYMLGLLRAIKVFCARYLPTLTMRIALVRLVKLCFLLFLLSDGVLLCLALYNQLLTLNKWLMLAMLLVLLAVATTCVLFDEILARCKLVLRQDGLPDQLRAGDPRPRIPTGWHDPSATGALETPLPSFSLPPWSQQGDKEHGHEEDEPSVPRIRVWETIDMSSTNIEHFLPPDAEWPHPPEKPA